MHGVKVMPNKTPVKDWNKPYVSELIILTPKDSSELSFDASGKWVLLPEITDINAETVIEIEASGSILNLSGLAKQIIYSVGIVGDDTSVFAGYSLTETPTMPVSIANYSGFRFKFIGKLYSQSIGEAFRTVPSATGNTQVTVSTIETNHNQGGILGANNPGFIIHRESVVLALSLNFFYTISDVQQNFRLIKISVHRLKGI